MATLQPASASMMAVARPMPEDAPVTNAVFPARFGRSLAIRFPRKRTGDRRVMAALAVTIRLSLELVVVVVNHHVVVFALAALRVHHAERVEPRGLGQPCPFHQRLVVHTLRLTQQGF